MHNGSLPFTSQDVEKTNQRGLLLIALFFSLTTNSAGMKSQFFIFFSQFYYVLQLFFGRFCKNHCVSNTLFTLRSKLRLLCLAGGAMFLVSLDACCCLED